MDVTRRTFMGALVGATAAWTVPGRHSTQVATGSGLNYQLGVCVPAYAGAEGGLLFASDRFMRNQVDAAVRAHIGWLRTDMVVQQGTSATVGVYDWSAWERTFAYARSKGMRILVSLQGQACVDGRAPSQPVTRTARSHVALFAAAAAQHFGEGAAYVIDAMEVGNEVNTKRFWPTPSVAQYGALLAAVYPAVKAVRPSLPVIASGTGGCSAAGDIPTTRWYSRLYAGGHQRHFDAVGLHPYSDFTLVPGRNQEANIVKVREIMNRHGDASKPIWGTESGAPTSGSSGVSEEVQARILDHSFRYFQSHAQARGPWFVYTLNDFQPAGLSKDSENYYGLRTSTGKAKPAYQTIMELARTSAGKP